MQKETMPSKTLFDRDILFPLLMIAVSVAALITISQFAEPYFQDASVNAQFFPSVIAIAQIIICVILMVQHKMKKQEKTERSPLFSKMAIFAVVFLISYAFLINLIGYLTASLVAFATYLVFFKVKKPLYYVIACAFVFGVYYLFGEVFFISLPESQLF